jgi:RHS repeat-associated protein
MRFTGEYHDTTAGLYHLRARQYDPVIGRFLATDPVTPALEDPYVAAYAYVNNRPTALTDPHWGVRDPSLQRWARRFRLIRARRRLFRNGHNVAA